MAYYKECVYCGSNLDPGEHCNCQNFKERKHKKKSTPKIGQAIIKIRKVQAK